MDGDIFAEIDKLTLGRFCIVMNVIHKKGWQPCIDALHIEWGSIPRDKAKRWIADWLLRDFDRKKLRHTGLYVFRLIINHNYDFSDTTCDQNIEAFKFHYVGYHGISKHGKKYDLFKIDWSSHSDFDKYPNTWPFYL